MERIASFMASPMVGFCHWMTSVMGSFLVNQSAMVGLTNSYEKYGTLHGKIRRILPE